MDNKKIKSELLRNFSFEYVHEIMSSIGWTWYDTGIPTPRELKETASILIDDVLRDSRKNITVGTGGLCVTKITDDGASYYKLVFELKNTFVC